MKSRFSNGVDRQSYRIGMATTPLPLVFGSHLEAVRTRLYGEGVLENVLRGTGSFRGALWIYRVCVVSQNSHIKQIRIVEGGLQGFEYRFALFARESILLEILNELKGIESVGGESSGAFLLEILNELIGIEPVRGESSGAGQHCQKQKEPRIGASHDSGRRRWAGRKSVGFN